MNKYIHTYMYMKLGTKIMMSENFTEKDDLSAYITIKVFTIRLQL